MENFQGKLYVALNNYLTEYKEKNDGNKYKPVAVGRYGIRTRESIYSKELAKDYSKNKVIFQNTLTVGMGSNQIDIGILDKDEIYSVSPAYHTYKISEINANYLRYCLECRNQDMFIRYVKRGSRQGKTIDLKRWLTYEIPVYDESTQQEIVSTLDKVSKIIENRKYQLDKLDELVKSRFIEMFGDPVLNPKGWDVVKIGDIATEVKYGTSLPAVEGGKYPYLRMNNMTNDGHLDLSNLKYIDVPDDEIEKCIVRKGDVLFNRTNSVELVGKTCVFDLDEEMIIAGYIIRVRIHETMLPIIFSNYMNTDVIKQYLRKIAKGAVNQANINAKELQAIQIYLPPLDLQNQFADFVAQVDKSKLAVQKSLEQLEILKKALMQEYFG